MKNLSPTLIFRLMARTIFTLSESLESINTMLMVTKNWIWATVKGMFFLQLCHLLHRLWELLQGIYSYTSIALQPPSFNRGPRALFSQMTTAPILEQPRKFLRWPRTMRTADDLQCEHISARKPTKTWPPETGEAPFACPVKWSPPLLSRKSKQWGISPQYYVVCEERWW